MTIKRCATTFIFILTVLLLVACEGSSEAGVIEIEATQPPTTEAIATEAVSAVQPTVETVATSQPDVEPINVVSSGEETSAETEIERPAGWSQTTHSKESDPDYATVFPADEVNTITINIAPEEWQTMMDDMTTLYGEFGAGSNRGPGGGGGGGGPGLEAAIDNPIWVAADSIEFEGLAWEHVGIRFKGNSSLRDPWSSGSLKLPFKLDFDRFEDEYPEIDDQRFYGFNQLTLANNSKDSSFMREIVASDIMEEAGVNVAESSFYNVFLDYGEGVVELGLYAMVEVVDDTVIETQFSDDNGNLYKPEGYGSSFAAGTFNEIDFDKETNNAEADYSDILALYDVLHDGTRTSAPEQWRANLETVFDVDSFINWLAVNTLIQNWDTYGVAYHNYFLYNNPETGLLTWIAWDLNESLSSGNRNATPSLALDEVNEEWPLIRYLLDDVTYQAMYVDRLEVISTTIFVPERMSERYNELAEMIAPYAESESSATAFAAAVEQLVNQVAARQTAANSYLDSLP